MRTSAWRATAFLGGRSQFERCPSSVAAQRRRALPLEEWAERVRWRDAQLLAHTALWDADTH